MKKFFHSCNIRTKMTFTPCLIRTSLGQRSIS